MASIVKDELPWLYDLAVDAYHETMRRSSRAKDAQNRVRKALDMLRHGLWVEMFDNKEMFIVLRELEHFVHEFSDSEQLEPTAVQVKSLPSKNKPSKGEQDN